MEENVFYKPGEPSSVMSLNEEVDLFASCVNIYTTETDVYGDIMDEPRELEVFDEGAWALNLATGIVATLGLAACAIAVVATGGAALAVVAFASAAVGTGVMTAGMSYADKKNQKNRSNLEYGIGLMLGAAVGALTGVGIMYAGPALTVAGEQAGFEASFLMGTNALTVSTIPDIVTAGGMTLLATDGAYVLNEINTMCTGQNLAVDTVFEGNEENYEACVVALQVLNDGLLDLTTRGYQRNGSGSSSSEAEKSDEGAEISESGVNIRGAGDESGSKADVLAQNRANGRAFEQQEFAKFSSQNNNAVEQITVKTSSGVRTRVDAIGLDANGNVVINEYKSSLTAPLTDNQKIAFPEIFESGATVVGKGKGIFSGGYQIPSGTKVTIIRPE